MKKAIEKLIQKYKERNTELEIQRPKIRIEFDWSSEAYEHSHNEAFIRDLKKLL